LEFYPLTTERWTDLEKLFGEKGACGGCWCMWWRSSYSEFIKKKGEKNKNALKEIVDSGKTPGIIAYSNEIPIGWISVSPRETYPRLKRSRILKQIDNESVWSIVCFFIKKEYRRKGVSSALLIAALNYIKKHGGTIAEGYPIDPKNKKYADAFAYTGLVSTFLKAGFIEIIRRSETRPIMRFEISKLE
jgi:GNAT superfamily N-acetyltransferase